MLRREHSDVTIGASHGLCRRKHVRSALPKTIDNNTFAADTDIADQNSLPLFVSFGWYGCTRESHSRQLPI